MARINVDSKALSDPRFGILGALLLAERGIEDIPMDYAADFGRGVMLKVWHLCLETGKYTMSHRAIFVLLNHPKGADILVESGLAELDVKSKEYRIRGTQGRIEWLEEKRVTGKKTGVKGAEFGKFGGRPRKLISTPPQKPVERVTQNRVNGFPENPPPAPVIETKEAFAGSTPRIVPGFDAEAEFSKLFDAHPNKSGIMLAKQFFAETVRTPADLASIKRAHASYLGHLKKTDQHPQSAARWFSKDEWPGWDHKPGDGSTPAPTGDPIFQFPQSDVDEIMRRAKGVPRG